MNRCQRIQQQLAESGPDAAHQDAQLQQHLDNCAQCSAMLQALIELDSELSELPEADAPDSLIASTLQAVNQAEPSVEVSVFDRYRFRWASGFAAVFVAVSVVGLWQAGLREMILQREYLADPYNPSASVPADGRLGADDSRQSDATRESSIRSREEGATIQPDTPALPSLASEPPPPGYRDITGIQEAEAAGQAGRDQQARIDELKALIAKNDELTLGLETAESQRRRDRNVLVKNEKTRQSAQLAGEQNALGKTGYTYPASEPEPVTAPASPAPEEQTAGAFVNAKTADDLSTATPSADLNQITVTGSRLSQADIKGGKPVTSLDRADTENLGPFQDTHKDQLRKEKRLSDLIKSDNVDFEADGISPPAASEEQPTPDKQLPARRLADQDEGGEKRSNLPQSQLLEHQRPAPAQQFLQQLDNLEGITFQPANGYWANTYVPGDPAMRLLQAQVNQWDRTALGSDLHLEQAALPIWQPFDIPQSTALATYLHSDKTFIDGPTRMQLQVGLQASEREGGQRPAMNLAVVLDLRGVTAEQFDPEIRALLDALTTARQTGDRFSLTIAGQTGGVIVPAGEFRHGPVSVAINQLFGEQSSDADVGLSLLEAIQAAADDLITDSSPDAALGANQMLLVTASPMGSEMETLQQTIHQNAVDGLLLSAITLGGETVSSQIDSLVLAGQGNRRTLLGPGDAQSLIEQELYSASRAVARAIRLRIQLAPGVQLIRVHGAQRLDSEQIVRVKQAEESIDQRLADNLGIAADRGDDEAGIQIVIPAMAAGSSHVILLDVVASQPGPIADVRVRYKDLSQVRNSVSRAQLSIDNQQKNAGRLERNVVKNLLALTLAEQITTASELLAINDLNGAKLRLHTARQLIAGLRQHLPDWASDQELLQDERMLADFLTALRSPAISQVQQRQFLAASLQLAAYRKITGPVQPE